MEEKLKQKDLTIDVTTFYTICELRRQCADVREVVSVVKKSYAPYYKEVTFTYQGCHYLVREDKVYVQTMITFE